MMLPMLGISTNPVNPVDAEKTSKTIQTFGLVSDGGTALGIETHLDREDLPISDLLKKVRSVWPGPAHLWDGRCTGKVKKGWPANYPFPFGESYGGITNILLVLSALQKRISLRIDPGTTGRKDFEMLLQQHTEAVSGGNWDAVSGQYSGDEHAQGRLAIRSHFVC